MAALVGAAETEVAEAVRGSETVVEEAAALARAVTARAAAVTAEAAAVVTARVRVPVLLAVLAEASWAAADERVAAH